MISIDTICTMLKFVEQYWVQIIGAQPMELTVLRKWSCDYILRRKIKFFYLLIDGGVVYSDLAIMWKSKFLELNIRP